MEETQEHLESQLREDFDNGRPESAVRLGEFMYERNEPEEAERYYRVGLERREPGAGVRLGDLLRDAQRRDEALEAYRSAMQLGDPEASVRYQTLLGLGQPSTEEQALRDSLSRNEPGAAVRLGDFLRASGRGAEARDTYAQGVSRGDPEAGARLDALAASTAKAQAPPPPQTSPADDTSPSSSPPPPPPPVEEFDFVSSAAADLPTDQDLLGFAALVEALHSLLDDQRTALPLALAITAPWGSGKSSVMWQLRERLHDPPPGVDTYRTWYTVKFDAWKYENSERLWAALAKAIYDQPQEDMGRVERLLFRVRLEYRRLALWKFLLKFAWPLLLAAGAVVIALNVDLSKAGAGAAGLATAAAVCAVVARYWTAIVNPFKQAMERYASAPDYEAHLGFTAEADRDIQALTELLCPSRGTRCLAIFVDDLDRCSSTHVVEVVEAMNQIFNSDARSGCVFVLGLDREVVATNINVAYKDTVEALEKRQSPMADEFGFQFLAKLVQMSVAIPPPQPAALSSLLADITATRESSAPSAVAEEVSEEEVEAAGQWIAGQQAPDLASVGVQVGAPSIDVSPAAYKVAEQRQRARRIRDSREVIAAEFNGLQYLDRNPRQVKRFHNAFRLQLYVANADPRLQFDFTGDQLIALSRWVALRVRWPGLAQDIDQEPLLLSTLESFANGMGPPGQQRWFARQDVIDSLREPEPDRRIDALPFQDFLQVT